MSTEVAGSLPRTISALDIDELPRGRRIPAVIELVHDGLGRAIQVPLLIARGQRPGPVFGITAAVHGNELNGVPVIHRLFERLDVAKVRGTVVAAVAVNIPGVLEHRRDIEDGIDLNRIMPGRQDGDSGAVYAFRLIDRVISRFDYLVDLHTASTGRVNSLYVRADMKDSSTAQMAYLQRPQIIVHNPPSDGTLRGAAAELGIPAITVEIGNPRRFQTEYIRKSLIGLRSMMAEVGVISRRATTMGPPPIVCERSYWLYADHGGLLEVHPEVTETVEAGQEIARLSDVFGNLTRAYCSPERGVVVGKSMEPVGQSGARILHLGIVATDAAFRAREPRPGRPRKAPLLRED